MAMAVRSIDIDITGALVVRPGETLVLLSSQQLTHDRAATIRERVEAELDGVHVVVVSEIDQAVVHRPSLATQVQVRDPEGLDTRIEAAAGEGASDLRRPGGS